MKSIQITSLTNVICSLFLLNVPSTSESVQLNTMTILEQLKPGEKKQVILAVTNDKDVPETVDFKLADYSSNSDGQHTYDEYPRDPNETIPSRSSARWIHLSQNRITLNPREQRKVYYEIEVPNDPNLKGSYWNIILVEPVDVESIKQPENNGFTLKVKTRYAHHTVVNVGEGSPKIKVIKSEIKEEGDNRYLCMHVLNEGDKFYDPTLTLKLYGKDGKLVKTLEGHSERLYPGNSKCFHLNLQGITEDELTNLTGFILFNGKDNVLFGDKFVYKK